MFTYIKFPVYPIIAIRTIFDGVSLEVTVQVACVSILTCEQSVIKTCEHNLMNSN